MTKMQTIETKTREFRAAHDLLAERVASMNDEIEKIKRRRLPGIKTAVQAAADARATLAGEIEKAPELFEKPKTVTIAGIRVGYAKGKGKIILDDPKRTLTLIKKNFPSLAPTCIRTSAAPNLKALANVPISTLKALGGRVEETGDQVVIKPVDDEVDKLVSALLAEAEKLEADEAAAA